MRFESKVAYGDMPICCMQTMVLCCDALFVCPFTSQLQFCTFSLTDPLALHSVQQLLRYTSLQYMQSFRP